MFRTTPSAIHVNKKLLLADKQDLPPQPSGLNRGLTSVSSCVLEYWRRN